MVEVEPGGSATATIRVRNQSTRVDGFRLEVVGVAAPWTTITPPVLQLFPKTEATATITFAPPRASVPRAGSYPFGIQAQSISNPDTSVVEEGDVVVRPFVGLQSALDGRIARGWQSGGHRVSVQNVGNAPARVSVRAVDPDEELQLSTMPEEGSIEPGTTGWFRTTVSRSLLLRGNPKRWPYSIQVSEASAGSESLNAIFEQRALIPGWLVGLAGAALAVAVALIAFPGLLDTITGGGATETPGATQVVVATPTEVAPTPPEPTPTEPAPTPTETPVVATPIPALASSITIDGPPEISGTFSAVSGNAFVQDGQMLLQLDYDVFGDLCHFQVSDDAFLFGPGTYPIGGVEDGLAYGLIQCEGSGAFYRSTNGTLRLDTFGAALSGTFDVFLTDFNDAFLVTGTFTDLPFTSN